MTKAKSKELQFEAKGDVQVKLVDYGDRLQKNKVRLWKALNHAGLSAEEKRLFVAIAMQETNHLEPEERDKSKDGTASENISLFNFNVDMIKELGFKGMVRDLNCFDALPELLSVVGKGLKTWGVRRFLDFHRGGRTGFNDGVSYDCYGYRNAIAGIMPYLRKDLPLAARDSRRAEVYTPHV